MSERGAVPTPKPFPWGACGGTAAHDKFDAGLCWCPPDVTLAQVRIMGHTTACSEARRGHAANLRRLSAIDTQRRADEAAGRQLREAAEQVLREAHDD